MKAYCEGCKEEVEVKDGRCPKGHEVEVNDSLGDLRAEVDKTFEIARSRVATALSWTGEGTPPAIDETEEADGPAAAPTVAAARTETPATIADQAGAGRRHASEPGSSAHDPRT